MSTLALHAAGRSVRRTRISLTHASVLIVLSVGLAGNALAGAFFGAGAYPFLEANRVAAVGLLQAYLLMALIGATVWVAAKSTGGLAWAWHLVLIAAHTIPLIAVALFTASTPEMTLGTVLISLGIHTVGIGAELYAGSLRDEG